MSGRLCEVCGTIVRNANPRVTTCGPQCRRVRDGEETIEEETRRYCRIPDADMFDDLHPGRMRRTFPPA